MNTDKIRELVSLLSITTAHSERTQLAAESIAELDKAPEVLTHQEMQDICERAHMRVNGMNDVAWIALEIVRDDGYLAPAAGLTVEEAMRCLAGATERGQLNQTWFRENLTAAFNAKQTKP